VTTYKTVFAGLNHFEKGGVEVINDNPKNYVFSNMFDVANHAKPWEKVAIAKNLEYVLEVIRHGELLRMMNLLWSWTEKL